MSVDYYIFLEKIELTVAFKQVIKYFLVIRECSRCVVSPHIPYNSIFPILGLYSLGNMNITFSFCRNYKVITVGNSIYILSNPKDAIICFSKMV
jgi:hypothetical protein